MLLTPPRVSTLSARVAASSQTGLLTHWINVTTAVATLAPVQPAGAGQKIGKYHILNELGKGATSAVYLALDPFANRKVAVKVVQREVLGDKDHGRRFRKLFLTEASLSGKLSHPHIVAIYDAVADDEGSYIVMEYVEGGTLEQYTKIDNLLPINKIIEIVFKCCKALDYAHRHGVIHRDIKPANILLSKDTDIKISDFGAALTSAAETTQVTGIGSPAYMSPEQVQEQQLTHQTDIFSLGVVMYQLLTGSLPFKATNNYSMVFQIINVDAPPPSIFRPEIPASVDLIVKRALQKRPESRYQTWEEFSQDLVRVFNNLQTPEQPVPDTEKFNTLRRLDFFLNFTDVDLWQVLHISNWSRIAAGHTLIHEGETGTSFFILASGEVKVSKKDRLLTVLKKGECFGEMAYLGRRQFKRVATVTTVSEVTVIEIKADALNAATETCRHQFTAAFLEMLVARLEAADVRLSELLLDSHVGI
jgi:serine/threonine protein kinase